MKKNALLFSPFIFPEPISTGKYNTILAQKLKQKGLNVEVVAFHPFYPDWKPKKTNVTLKNIKIYRGGGLLPYPKSIVLRRLQLELSFTFHSVRHIISKRKVDIILPIFPPIFFLLFIRFFLQPRTRKIGIVHDIQGIMANVTNGHQKKSLLAVIRFLEKKAFSMCDKIIFISESMAKKCIVDYGIDPKKISIAYPFLTLEKNNTQALENLFQPGHKHIVYSGAIGEKQNPYELLKFFHAIARSRKDIICHIFSRGPLFEGLKQTSPSSKRMKFHDLVPEENLYELYLRSDAQIIPQKPGTSDGAIPSKLPNLIAAGTPIFAISEKNSDLANLVNKSSAGVCATSWNIDKLVIELNNFLNLSKNQTHFERQQQVKDFVDKHFSIHSTIKLIVDNPA